MPFLSRLMPFIGLGVALALFAVGLWLAIHVLIIGAIVGLILFAVAAIRNALFPNKSRPIMPHQSPKGRTFDHDERD